MTLPVEINPLLLTQSGSYTIGRSLRFRSGASAFLSRTFGSAGSQTTWTFATWVKRGSANGPIFAATTGSGNTSWGLWFNGDNIIWTGNGGSGGATYAQTSAVYRDYSAWYHIVLKLDTTNATAANRFMLWVNGVQVTNWAINPATGFTQNSTWFINGASYHTINTAYTPSGGYFGGYGDQYFAETYFIDGQALNASSFGSFDTNGVWQPKKYTGTYGTNGFYLNFSDNSAATAAAIGKDSSGNGNNWTPNNISLTAGTTYDSMVDSPTVGATASNYPVMNPLDKGSNLSLSNGNLQLSITAGGNDCLRCTMAIPSTGKWYWEGTLANVGSGSALGFADATTVLNSGSAFTGVGYSATNGQKFQNNWTGVTYGSTYTTNDVVGVAVDADAGTVTFYKNNVSQGVAYSSLNFATTTYFPFFFTTTTGGSWIVNFGQRPFTYTPPTGFNALNTYNLPAPTILAGNKHFDVVTFTGDGTNGRVITGLNFQPDLLWQKGRSSAYQHYVFDVLRGTAATGTANYLVTNSTAAEQANNNTLVSFNPNGFTLNNGSGTPGGINDSAQAFVDWVWKAGGVGVTNTSGTITSQVSANPSAGFSVVTYSGNSSTATVGHGLGVAPSMYIVKSRTNASGGWTVYHTSIGPTGAVQLQSTSATITSANWWNNTAPTSSVFSLAGVSAEVNTTGNTYVAYCFAAVAGYSAFGRYTGNGSTDGTFIYTGFRPRFFMVKRTDTAESYWIIDSARLGFNSSNPELYPGLTNTEGGNATSDILSNGIKLRNTWTGANTSGATYIYAAFAENPFNYSRAR